MGKEYLNDSEMEFYGFDEEEKINSVGNKMKKEEFLELSIDEKLDRINEVLHNNKTEVISQHFDFSYGWLVDVFEGHNIFYVGKLKQFIIKGDLNSVENDINTTLTKEEIKFIKRLLKEKVLLENDIRSVVGCCGKEIDRSYSLDEKTNKRFKEFCRKNKAISNKDLVTAALNEFMEKYDRR